MRQRQNRPPHNRGKSARRRPARPGPGAPATLPEADVAASQVVARPVANGTSGGGAGGSGGRRKLVLVVEDFASVGGLVAGLVRQAGYRSVRAWDAREACRLARERRPDLVVLDLNAPNETAVETLRQLRADQTTGGCPLLVVSAPGLDLPPDEQPAVEDVVAKPFDIDVMLNAIRRVLGDPLVEVPPRQYPTQDYFLNGY